VEKTFLSLSLSLSLSLPLCPFSLHPSLNTHYTDYQRLVSIL
jgi:hypothetical protein